MKQIHPTNYLDGITNIPTSPDDFIGGARDAAKAMALTIAKAKSREFAPIKLMYAGAPGIGKTALSYFARHLLGVNRFACHDVNGTDVTIEFVRDLRSSMHLSANTLFGDYRLICVHESDKMSAQAQAGFLTMLDNLPSRACVICTTNQTIASTDKMERERFTSRCKYTEILPPTPQEVANMLTSKFGVPTEIASQIAVNTNGNVRAALLEAEEWLDCHQTTIETTISEPVQTRELVPA